jgi:hypothetical protein
MTVVPVNFLKGKKFLSYREYVLIMVLFWVYTLVWAAGLVATWLYRDSLEMYLKAVIFLALILLTPAGSDLIQSYQKYKQRWEHGNLGK